MMQFEVHQPYHPHLDMDSGISQTYPFPFDHSYSYTQGTFCDGPSFLDSAPPDSIKVEHAYGCTPLDSPSTAPPHSAEHLPSALSHASSAGSSAVGSPHTGGHGVQYEGWIDVQGLGLISNENIIYTSVGAEADMVFAHNDKQTSFVGECADIPCVKSSDSVPYSAASSSQSSVSAPIAAMDPSVTIDTILEQAESAVTTPKRAPSPGSSRRSSSPISAVGAGNFWRLSKGNGPFRSPTAPASAGPQPCDRSSSVQYSPAVTHRRGSLQKSVTGAGISKSRPSPPFSPKRSFTSVPSPPHPESPKHAYATQIHNSFFAQSSGNFVQPLESSYPSLIQPAHRGPYANPTASYATDDQPLQYMPSPFRVPSPVPSPAISPLNHLQTQTYPDSYSPYPQAYKRGQSCSSIPSNLTQTGSPSSAPDVDEEARGKCPHPECGKSFKDLKAHMLTHQSERPEKCPILNCEYNHKGFARKYDKNRHTLTHYKGTMVCGFCPGSGSAAEKSFNRADVFKRHLTSVHAVEQSAPNSRKRSPTAGSQRKLTSYSHDATGKCSTCSSTFNNAQEFYEHLDECVLRVVQQEEPSEAINQQRLTEISSDPAVKETMERHMLSTDSTMDQVDGGDEDDEDDDDERDPTYNRRSGKGAIKAAKTGGNSRAILGNNSAITKTTRTTNGGPRRGLTYSRGGVPLVGKGRKKRKHYPASWGCPADRMKMKKRVFCVYDGPRRLWKDDMMLSNDFEVRMKLPDGKSYVTDLDVETLKRVEALHNATEEERGPWVPEMQEVDISELMRFEG